MKNPRKLIGYLKAINHLILITFLFLLPGCMDSFERPFEPINQQPIELTAYFMQYACGESNDDMRVLQTDDSDFQYLSGKDIDPEMMDGPRRIRGWLYDNYTEKSRFGYSLTGFVEKCSESGCNNGASRFRITHIEKLDGQPFEMIGNSY